MRHDWFASLPVKCLIHKVNHTSDEQALEISPSYRYLQDNVWQVVVPAL